jgi:dienelactone hydrolase
VGRLEVDANRPEKSAVTRIIEVSIAVLCLSAACSLLYAAEGVRLDELTRRQAELERRQMAEGKPHEFDADMAAFRQTAEIVEYQSGEYRLPGYLYKPSGAGPFPVVIWNHGSEKNPRAQPELARFYTAQGYVFFVPLRHGHGRAPGPYIGDLQQEARAKEADRLAFERRVVELHELYNQDVVAAVEWLKRQPFVDSKRLVMSGVSYGGIQTVLTAERELGIRAFVPFAPAAMSFANGSLRERLKLAAGSARAPMFVLQARNDYSTGPAEMLGPILERRGDSSGAKLYPAFGATPQDGHGAFACRSLGVTIWAPDVLGFIDAAMKMPPKNGP